MSTTLTSTPESEFQQIELLQQLTKVIRHVLNRVYLDGVDRVFRIEISETGGITGVFIDGRQAYDFSLSGETISYKQIIRKDSYIEGVIATVRTDAVKKRRCKVGFSCGNTCIARGLTCNVNVRKVLRPKEAIAIRDLAMKLRSPAVGGKITPIPQADVYDEMTIRELKREARGKMINNYSNMTSEELRESLRIVNKDPESRERIRKTLDEREKAKRKALRLLPKDLAKLYRTIQKAARLFSANPDLAGVLAASIVIGGTVAAASQIKRNYKDGLTDSAKLALDRSGKIPLERVGNKDIIFTVGGYNPGDSRSGQKMKDFLESPLNNTPGERWFTKENKIIAVDHRDKQIPDFWMSKKNQDGSYNPAYLGYAIKQGFGKSIQNLQQGNRSEPAIDLAAQLYAYGADNKKAKINVLGHGAAETREAIEILNRMRPDKGISGKEIAQRISLVNMGSPYWGMTNDKSWNDIPNRTITSKNDPFSIFPKILPQFVNGVRGHEVGDYLGNNEVRDRIRESFGYYTSSIENKLRQKERKATFHGNIAETLGDISPALGKSYGRLIKLMDFAKERPFQASVRVGALLVPVGVGTYLFARKRYQAGVTRSAELATEQYRGRYGRNSPEIASSNVMFTVGSPTTSSQELAQIMRDPNLGFEAADGNYQIVSDWGQDESPPIPSDLQPGTREYNMWVAQQGYGKSLKATVGRLARSVSRRGNPMQSPESVKLASEIYAYARATHDDENGGKNIPVLAHGSGGLTAREAVEIVRRMKPGGRAIANRLKLVTLGTPHFGISGDNPAETAISSEGDFFHRLPRPKRARTVNVQAGHGTARDYFNNPTSRAEIERAFKSSARINEEDENTFPSSQQAQSPVPPAPPGTPPPVFPVSPPPSPTPPVQQPPAAPSGVGVQNILARIAQDPAYQMAFQAMVASQGTVNLSDPKVRERIRKRANYYKKRNPPPPNQTP